MDKRSVKNLITMFEEIESRWVSTIEGLHRAMDFERGVWLGVVYGIVGNLWAHCFASVVFDGLYGLYVYGLAATSAILIVVTVHYWRKRRETMQEIMKHADNVFDLRFKLREYRVLLEALESDREKRPFSARY